jgi:hypothetical protein
MMGTCTILTGTAKEAVMADITNWIGRHLP